MRALVLAAACATWLSAGGVHAQGGEPATAPITPPGYGVGGPSVAPGQGVPYAATTVPVAGPRVEVREREESIRSLWIPGLIGLPLAWILTWSVAATTSRLDGDAIEFSYIPLIGPWLMLGEPLNGEEGYYVAAGVFQGVSAIALVTGLAIRRTVREQVWVAGVGTVDVDVDLHVTPIAGGGAATALLSF